MTGILIAGALVASGMLAGYTFATRGSRPARPRYSDPGLHRRANGVEDWYPERPGVFLRANDRTRAPQPLRWHRNGIPWDAHPLPKPRHECWPQTCEIALALAHTDRCPCGGYRYGIYGNWQGVNSRWNTSTRSSSDGPAEE